MDYLEIGKIVNTHGIKGELKVRSFSDFDRFAVGNVVYMGNEKKPFTIKTHRIHQGMDLILFEGYANINDVLSFKNQSLYIDKSSLEKLDEDEYYFYELVGLDVYNQHQVFIGVVDEIRELPQGALLEIKREGQKKALVPFVSQFVLEVSDDRIIINEIEGLL